MNETELVETFANQARLVGTIVSLASPPVWLNELEAKLPFQVPHLLHSLLSRYEFEPFDIHGIELFGNAGESSEPDHILSRLFSDKALTEALFHAGLFQIGRPSTGSYDPVCIEPASKVAGGQVVLLDHEQILCNSRVVVSKVLFPSLKAMFLAPGRFQT